MFDSSDSRNVVPRFTPETRRANLVLVDLLRTTAEVKKATLVQIAPGCLPRSRGSFRSKEQLPSEAEGMKPSIARLRRRAQTIGDA